MTDRDALVKELEAAGVLTRAARNAEFKSFSAGDGGREAERHAIATDCDLIAPILVRHASPEVRAAIRKELNAARAVLCADCGHPKSWHTGSFTACNGTARCLCDGFLAPAPTTDPTEEGK